MITHAPGPFELMIRRVCDNIGDWLDRRAVRELVRTHGISVPSEPRARVEHEPESQAAISPAPVAPVSHEPRVAHPTATGKVAAPRTASKSVAHKAAHVQPRDLLQKIAKAIEDGRASGSQREIARAFNVSRATVQRAQRLVREAA